MQLPGHLLMDTIGPHALEPPDAQVHSHGLDKGRVAGLLSDPTRSGSNLRSQVRNHRGSPRPRRTGARQPLSRTPALPEEVLANDPDRGHHAHAKRILGRDEDPAALAELAGPAISAETRSTAEGWDPSPPF
ncbi:hypothetical protein Vau01_098920 [Virgisporangium aurantiacum]|uniref:Uncharacterized protein n=1 Tax=Virgisporangium aurantiacum TaxID=175570 RepID=A0A8J3ZIX5_9ACTN|nr:hypothetical protein Vau01_098920 [Virgisporangium aurantiacum]